MKNVLGAIEVNIVKEKVNALDGGVEEDEIRYRRKKRRRRIIGRKKTTTNNEKEYDIDH